MSSGQQPRVTIKTESNHPPPPSLATYSNGSKSDKPKEYKCDMCDYAAA